MNHTEPLPHVPDPGEWLHLRATHSGRGRAVFTNPPGQIEGPAVVRVDRRGQTVVTIDNEVDPGPGFQFHHGSVSAENLRRPGFSNPCSLVEVQTADGTFIADERIFLDSTGTQSRPQRVRLTPSRARYVANIAEQARYWVLPLTNFVLPDFEWGGRADARWRRSVQRRMKRAGPVPPAEDPPTAQPVRIRFSLCGQQAFIQLLPDYTNRVERLERGRVANLLTAFVVAPAHANSVSFTDHKNLFPVDMLAMLTLATGVRVGAPWVEFRSSRWELVRRDYIQFGTPAYEHGRSALSPRAPGAVGPLLTGLFSSPELGQNYLRAAVHQAIEAAFPCTLEIRVVHLVRSFETLCRHFGFGAMNLTSNLDAAQIAEVNAALTAAIVRVAALRMVEADPDRRRSLQRIGDRVRSMSQKENDFGRAVLELLRRFDLPDADVLQPHLAAHPVAGNDNWPGLISCYRGTVTHEGYFDLSSGRHDTFEILDVTDHFHDVLLRVLFKIVGYEGPYQIQMPPRYRCEPVAWVTLATHPRALGYH